MLKKYGIREILLPAGLLLCLLLCLSVRAGASWEKNSDGELCWYEDGKLVQNQWISANYYVGSDGQLYHGWLHKGGKWYFFSKKTGKMLRSIWFKSGSKIYYASSDGSLYTGGIYKIGSAYYCFNSRGVRLTGKQTVKKKTYYFSPSNGAMFRKKWVRIDGKYYYFGSSGAMQKNKWIGRYYVGSDGARLTGAWQDDKYLGEDGQAVKGLQEIDGSYYYFNTSTYVKVTSRSLKIGDNTWYFDKNGVGTVTGNTNLPVPSVSVESQYYTDKVVDDETFLAAIIYCEAGNQSYTGQKAVGMVILNRVNTSGFPSTLREVVYQKNQFEPARNGSLTSILKDSSPVTASCKKAAKLLLKLNAKYQKGITPTLTVNSKKISFPYLFFMTKAAYKRLGLTSSYIKIGDHVFFKTWSKS